MIARILVAALLGTLALGACDRAKPLSRAEWEALPDVYAGKLLFITRCGRCHGANGGPARTGPDLQDVARRRSDAYLREWIADPKSLKPDARMLPVYLDDVELDRLLAFLHGLPGSLEAEPPEGWRD